ncbi:MAG: hypothetical protein B7X04_02085 [Parcubacteria group bacterium 21-54-25]|nr:MAG: hypothetical protein B7X04_02085 [Parcubacteria group bacterium 21-54-25]HQU07640.1 DUF87 domain-containing protein [Candidatus Paceibacterota bacterium]
MEGTPQLSTPEEELAHLRAQVAAKEQELITLRQVPLAPEAARQEREAAAHEAIQTHRQAPQEAVLAPPYRMAASEVHELSLGLDPDNNDDTMTELYSIMETRGIKNSLAVLDKLNNPHITDDFHRFLVRYVAAGLPIRGMVENAPRFRALHMTLYEVTLPEHKGDAPETRGKTLKELVSAMEQFYSGMLAVGAVAQKEPPYVALELAVPVESAHLFFYVAIPNSRRDLFEKQLLAVFPDAHIEPQPNDYNIFVENGASLVSTARLAAPAMLPLKDYTDFDYDPLNTILNAFAKIETEGEGAALQIIFEPQGQRYTAHYRKILSALRKGVKREEAFKTPETTLGEVAHDFGKLFFRNKPKDEEKAREAEMRQAEANKNDIEQVEKKISAPVVGITLRLLVSSPQAARTDQVLSDLEAAFNQFDNTFGNRLIFTRATGSRARAFMDEFSFRTPSAAAMPLSLRELTTLYHFPPEGIESSPHLKQTRFTAAPAPLDLPQSGTVLGTNLFRGKETKVRIAEEDRLRHLYVIGQTGTGKTVFLKTLIAQDIKAGAGACFIDPHGNDILDILAMIPPERYEDVIYFDPAYIERPFGLNLLEYDPKRPEQKTFIVNELLAIFRRLYGDVPESMGPAFEQYFRNATQLVMEDPGSGSTMLDIPRVLSNTAFRNMKLSRSRNPVVNQFWTEIATQAGGEASLENIVPYITNKFDDFTANDFMRPIVGQQESSFDFRQIMDQKKILLVNLSKGRLGERNANLIGLVLVGKIFMAALSRADSPGTDFPPFYLYIDEFQNITTDSIPGILSEARKYKLSLNIAHQYLDQVDEKIRDAIFGNVGSMAVFRVGEEDGEFFAKQFAPTFETSDFISIENYRAYVKILARGVPQKPFNIETLPPPQRHLAQVDDLRQLSYLTYGRDRTMVEETIHARYLTGG